MFSVESIVLFCHLLGAFLLVGGLVVTGVAFEAARRGQTPVLIATLLGLARVRRVCSSFSEHCSLSPSGSGLSTLS